MRAPKLIYPLIFLLFLMVIVGATKTISKDAVTIQDQKRIIPTSVTKSTTVPAFIQKINNKQPVTIIAYGDSITWGYIRDASSGKVKQVKNPYPKVLEKELRKKYGYNEITVINKGHPGWTTIQALEFVEKEVLSYHPDLVISMFGINDARGHVKYSPNASPNSVDDFKENYQELVKVLKANGLDTVILTATTITSKKNNAHTAQEDYSRAVKSVAQEENIPYINGSTISIKGNLYDGVHFKADKYRLIAEKVMSGFFDTY
ncbi:SGNH/GDSL hydrolase family protein [Fredinandcohnia sp. 179-A 10B2 NHS]|uniref:SGNH/GDSL hydrolase family protein n=1 Tax=Fredinandcohnia sp. 179-A 10B2 NHS TaxID=3235176 RepID=UPI00399EEE93